jgi:hypothetical protein
MLAIYAKTLIEDLGLSHLAPGGNALEAGICIAPSRTTLENFVKDVAIDTALIEMASFQYKVSQNESACIRSTTTEDGVVAATVIAPDTSTTRRGKPMSAEKASEEFGVAPEVDASSSKWSDICYSSST